MDGRCETCKWWNRRESDVRGRCELTEVDPHGVRHDQTKAFAADTGGDCFAGMCGWLITEPDFGCVQYERKDP